MIEFIKRDFLFIVLSCLILFTFWNLWNTFYQQDEWQVLGLNLVQGLSNTIHYSSPLQLLFAEGRPLNRAVYLIFFGIFKFDILPIAIFSLVFHTLNGFLIFNLARKISGKELIAFFASIFFVVNSVSNQAVTWPAATITVLATTLIILSIVYYFKFLGENNRNFLYLSFLLGLISLFFKETGLFLFVLFPLMYVIYKKTFNFKKVIKVHLPILIYGGLLLLFRIFELSASTSKTAGFEGGGHNFLQSVLFHAVLYPLTSLFQIFVPAIDLYSFTGIITRIQYKFLIGSPLIDLVGQSVVTDMISIMGSMFILLALFLATYRNKDKITGRNIIFALAFFFLSFLPYAVLYREGSYLSSRYFYVAAIPAGILFGYLIHYLTEINRYVKWIVVFLAALFLFHHASVVKSDINYQVNLGNQRKAVLAGIKSLYPKLEKDSIIYVTSDKEYYGPITNPFQNGLGYVLEVWYYDSGNIPKEFLNDNFLWDLGAEGYRKTGRYGFGYYQDIEKMVSDMKINKLKISQVHAFFIRSSDTKVLDITSEIKDKISMFSAIPK